MPDLYSPFFTSPFKQHSLSLAFKPISIFLALSSGLVHGADTRNEHQSVLEVITVTAEKREIKLLDIPSSISAKNRQELLDAGIESMTELSQHIPNLHIFSWGGRRDTNVFIRGIGPGLFTEPTVGFYVDGVNYSNNGMFDMDLADIKRVEVLRGPQGTLYGGNSLAGVINIITQQPDNESRGRASLSLDDLSRSKLNANFSTPLKEDSLFLGLSIAALKADGYIYNTFLKEDFGERDDISARAKLRWLANEKLEAILTIDYEKFRGDSYAMGPAAAIYSKPDQINHDYKGIDDRDSLGTALTLNWTGNNIDFTSVTSWRDWDNFNSADQDAGSLATLVYNSETRERHEQLSQELRWTSTTTSPLQWIAGLYAYTSEFQIDSLNTFDFTAFGSGPGQSTSNTLKENQGYAAFGQLDYSLNDKLTLTGGLRLDHEERKAKIYLDSQPTNANSPTLEGGKDFNELLPKIALSYTANNDGLLYGSISKGYRAGGFDTLYPNLSNPTFDSETSINYELGYKVSLLDSRLDLSAAVFLIDIKDQQVQQLLPNGTIITDNAAESRSQGFEFESRFIPAEGWLISLAGSYTDATFQVYEGIDVVTYTPQNYAGLFVPNSPKFTTNFSIQNRRSLGNQLTLFSRLDNQYVGPYYFDALNQFKQEAYNLLNFKIGVEADNWDVHLWVKNALDEYYSKIEFEFGFGPTVEAGTPRSFGITASTFF